MGGDAALQHVAAGYGWNLLTGDGGRRGGQADCQEHAVKIPTTRVLSGFTALAVLRNA